MCRPVIPCIYAGKHSFTDENTLYRPSCPLLVPQVKTSSAVQHTDAVLHAATPRTVLFLIAPEIFRGVAWIGSSLRVPLAVSTTYPNCENLFNPQL